MKTATQFFPLMIALLVVSMAGNVYAQGRGHHHHQKNDHKHHYKKDKHEHHDRDYGHHDHYGHRDHHHHHRHDHHRVVHRHDHHHAPVVVRHHHPRPRYVYYRDYDVYYDLHRDVYISYSGRRWSVSASLPIVLHHVDTRRAVRMEVEYFEDDFPAYLERSRPAYRRIYTGS